MKTLQRLGFITFLSVILYWVLVLYSTVHTNTTSLGNISVDMTQAEFLSMMRRRVSVYSGVCTQISRRGTQQPEWRGRMIRRHIRKVMYALPSVSLLWCPVYKAGSTNWMVNIVKLAPGRDSGERDGRLEEMRVEGRQPNEIAREVAPSLHYNRLQDIAMEFDSRRLLIVRHPFHRLVSAFRDKLERCHGELDCTRPQLEEWYYKDQGRYIVEEFREKAELVLGKEYFSKENNYGAPLPSPRRLSPKLPSWWEFVQYLLEHNPEEYDEHWRPVYYFCHPCSFSYNYILKYENLEVEEAHFVSVIGAENIIQSQWWNRNREHDLSEDQLVQKYMELLTEREVRALYEIYRFDFEMFGYSWKGMEAHN